jgi:methionyl-tRNA formyltransferase
MSPHPAAYTELAGKNIKIYTSHVELVATGKEPGSFDTDHKTYLRFAAADGWVYIDELQQEGKKRMHIADFLRGFRS